VPRPRGRPGHETDKGTYFGGEARAGVALGSDPYTWFVSFEPIEDDGWIDIEVWRDERWVTFARM
jgi:hypothetical protein